MDSSKKLKTEPDMGKTFQIQFKLSFLVPHPHHFGIQFENTFL